MPRPRPARISARIGHEYRADTAPCPAPSLDAWEHVTGAGHGTAAGIHPARTRVLDGHRGRAGRLGRPGFRDLERNAARTSEVNLFLQAIYLARSEAIKRNGVVSLCPSLDGASCAAGGTAWHRGWIVFVNLDRDSPAVRDAGEDLLQAYPAWSRRPRRRQPRHAVVPRLRPERRHRDLHVLRRPRQPRAPAP